MRGFVAFLSLGAGRSVRSHGKRRRVAGGWSVGELAQVSPDPSLLMSGNTSHLSVGGGKGWGVHGLRRALYSARRN